MKEHHPSRPASAPEPRRWWSVPLRTVPLMVAVVTPLLGLTACPSGADLDDPASFVSSGNLPPGVCDAPTNVFLTTCAGGPCHDPGNVAMTVDLITDTEADPLAARLVNMPASYMSVLDPEACPMPAELLINPTNIEASLLLVKVLGMHSCGGPMPLTGQILPDDQINCIRTWAEYVANPMAGGDQ